MKFLYFKNITTPHSPTTNGHWTTTFYRDDDFSRRHDLQPLSRL